MNDKARSVIATTTRTRGRYAVSIRVLMVLVLVLGGGFGWTANRANRRRAAVDAIKQAKGSVLFDYQFAGGQLITTGKPWPPEWLLAILPVEFFHDVTSVLRLDFSQAGEKEARLAAAAINDFERLERLRIIEPPPGTRISGLGRLKLLTVTLREPRVERPFHLDRLESLKEVYLDGPGVNDVVLSEIVHLPALREIRLQNTSITDRGLARLGELADLEVLWAGSPKLTDAGLAGLVKLRKLTILNVSGSLGVTDDGVKFLSSNLPGLKHLLLSYTGVTDAGLAYLRGFDGLEGIQIDGQGVKITDAGLAHLKGLDRLEVLNLSGSGVTDSGLTHLQGLRKLRWLNLRGTAVGDAGLARIAEIKSLRMLMLSDLHITDAGLLNLSELDGIEQLFMDETDVTDAGLKHLHGLKSLKTLWLSSVSISVEGVAALRAALPPSTVVRMGTVKGPRAAAAPAPGAERIGPVAACPGLLGWTAKVEIVGSNGRWATGSAFPAG